MKKVTAACLISSFAIAFFGFGCDGTPDDYRDNLMMFFPEVNGSRTFQGRYEVEKHWDSQAATRNDGYRASNDPSDANGALGLGFAPDSNLHFGVKLQRSNTTPGISLSIQYDFLHWQNGKLAANAMLGGSTAAAPLWGIGVLIAQEAYQTPSFAITPFLGAQYRRVSHYLREVDLKPPFPQNEIGSATYALDLLGGVDFSFNNFFLEATGGWERHSSTDIHRELSAPSYYALSNNAPFLQVSVGVFLDRTIAK